MNFQNITQAMTDHLNQNEAALVADLVRLSLEGNQSLLSIATIGQQVVNAARRAQEAALIEATRKQQEAMLLNVVNQAFDAIMRAKS